MWFHSSSTRPGCKRLPSRPSARGLARLSRAQTFVDEPRDRRVCLLRNRSRSFCPQRTFHNNRYRRPSPLRNRSPAGVRVSVLLSDDLRGYPAYVLDLEPYLSQVFWNNSSSWCGWRCLHSRLGRPFEQYSAGCSVGCDGYSNRLIRLGSTAPVASFPSSFETALLSRAACVAMP